MKVSFLDVKRITESYNPQLLDTLEEVAISGWYLNGQWLNRFEEKFAAYTGTTDCVGVATGLDALTLILLAMKHSYGWNDSDEVIVPALTFVATAESVYRSGLKPVFCDINDKFVIDEAKIQSLITHRTRAIIPVHLYGFMADMKTINSIARANGLKVIEDAAQAHGAVRDGYRAGGGADAAAFSFYPGKNLGALGNGGAITTNNSSLAQCIRQMANYGANQKYQHELHGLNSRLDELQAAVLCVKLARLDKDNLNRKRIADIYSKNIKNRNVQVPYGGDTLNSVFHIYPVMVMNRSFFQNELANRGIQTLIHYPIAVHKQTCFSSYRNCRFPMAEYVADHEVSLPISPLLTEEEANYVVETINQYVP